jgi:hypothetical protein
LNRLPPEWHAGGSGRGEVTHPAVYRIIGYTIAGQQLTIEIIDFGCAATGAAPLLDQVHLAAIFTTSPFTKQP